MRKSNGHASAELFGDEHPAPEMSAEQRDLVALMGELRESMAATMALAARVEEKAAAVILAVVPQKPKRNIPKELLTYFDTKHQEKIKDPATGEGIKAKIDGSKDAPLIMRLYKTYGEERLKNLIDRFFEQDDDFLRERTGYTVGALSSRVAALVSSSSLPVRRMGVTRNTEHNARNSAVAEDMIRQAYGARR